MKNNLSSLRPSVVTTLIWTAFLSRTKQNSIVAGKELFDYHIDKTLGLQPKFDSILSNISVVSGYTVVLPCSIENLGKFKVAWLDPSSMALTYEDRRVVDDTRFIVVRPNIQDWHLQVRETRIEDTGSYRCTVNTHEVKSKTINLFVKEPPRLLDSSKGQTVSEGSNVFLFCNFTGVPRPVVRWSWRNLLDESLVIKDVWKIPSDVHEQQCPTSSKTAATVLEVRNISRHCTGYFICVADNQVGQVGRKFIPVNVEFAPEVLVTNKRIGQYRNKETILECQIFAHPLGLTFWQKDGEKVEGRTDRRTEIFEHFVGRDDAPRSHRRHITISLRIFITNDDDYGTYRCIAENSLGNNSDETVLHEIKEAPRKASQSSAESILVDGKGTKAKQAKQNGTLPAYRTEAINFRQVLSDELKNRLGVSEASPSPIFLGPHSGIVLVWMLCFVLISRK